MFRREEDIHKREDGLSKRKGEVKAAPGGDGLFQKREILKLRLKSC